MNSFTYCMCLCLLLLLAVPILLTSLSSEYYPVQADETTLAWMAKQVCLGQTPYKDYQCLLPPFTVYSLALFFKCTAPTLSSLRQLMLFCALLITIMFFIIHVRIGMDKLWAFLAALVFPWVTFIMWPIPSHHWFGCGCGLVTLSFINGDVRSGWQWVAAGVFAAFTFLFLQSDGTVVCGLVLLCAMCAHENRKSCILKTALPMAVIFILAAAFLWFGGILVYALDDLLLAPMQYYKQAGGFNDVALLSHLLDYIHHGMTLSARGFVSYWMMLPILLLPVLGLISMCAAKGWKIKPFKFPDRFIENTVGLLLVLWVYSRGRTGFIHLAFYYPYFLVLSLKAVKWREEFYRPLFWKIWIAVILLNALFYWGMILPELPPIAREDKNIDQIMQNKGVVKLVKENLPAQLPVLYLPHGSVLYFYYAPVPPDVDWLLPPSCKANSSARYEKFVKFARKNNVPYIIIHKDYAARFLKEPSPVREMLRKYHYAGEMEQCLLFKKK